MGTSGKITGSIVGGEVSAPVEVPVVMESEVSLWSGLLTHPPSENIIVVTNIIQITFLKYLNIKTISPFKIWVIFELKTQKTV